METNELIKALRWIAANDETVFNADKATEAADALEELQAQLAQVTAERDGYKGTLDSANQTNAALAKKALQIQVERDETRKALRFQKEAEKNEPLTQEEVRQMVGEWVWVVVTYESGYSCQGYALIAPGKAGFLEQVLPIDFYGKKWLAYRHRTKEDAENV